MRRHKWNRLALLSGGVLCVSLALGVGAQDAGQAGEQRAQVEAKVEAKDQAEQTGQTQVEDRAVIRERLTQRLEWTQERISRHQEHEKGLILAIERLDAGESPAAISKDMMERVQDQLRGQRGPGGDERPSERPGGHRRGPMPPMDSESRDQALTLLKVQAPARHKQVAALSKSDSPEQVDRLLQRLAPKLQEIRRAQDTDPKLAGLLIVELHANLDLTFRSRDHRELLGGSEATERQIAESEANIQEAFRRSFDAHLALKQHEVESLEGRLLELREEIERRRGMRDELIRRQIQRAGSPAQEFRGRGRRG